MMPNIVRGDRMAGLVTYLVSEGRHNEHEEPHLVAGDDALLSWHGEAELSRESGMEIARHLDRPHKAFDTEISGGYVWHCSLSLRAEEGKLTDAKWGEISRDFMKLMDLDDHEGTKAPTRWAAFRHGVSQNGNDHIHIAVNLVREDGTKANVHNDFHRAQKAARALESKYGLEELESVKGSGLHAATIRPNVKRRHALAPVRSTNALEPNWVRKHLPGNSLRVRFARHIYSQSSVQISRVTSWPARSVVQRQRLSPRMNLFVVCVRAG